MNWIMENLPAWNSWLAVGLYWLPLAICALGYTVLAFDQVKKDKIARMTSREVCTYYSPSITVGTLVGYALLTVMPIANILSVILEILPELLRKLEKALDIPLVKK